MGKPGSASIARQHLNHLNEKVYDIDARLSAIKPEYDELAARSNALKTLMTHIKNEIVVEEDVENIEGIVLSEVPNKYEYEMIIEKVDSKPGDAIDKSGNE